jgi:cyclic beta-1,2-glucan synthetase
MQDAVELPPALLQRLTNLADNSEPVADGELWDLERLEQYGRFLATEGCCDQTQAAAGDRDYRGRLRRDAAALESAYRAIVAALQAGRAISPAAQWILDNFHVISDHLNDIPLRLPRRMWRELPRASGRAGSAAIPRVLLIAAEFLRHTLWNFRQQMLIRLLHGYQEVAPLQMREIWALHTVLRLALIDELRQIAIRVEDSLAARAAADELADSLLQGTASREPDPDRLAWSEDRFSAPFIVQLAHRLQGMGERGRPLLDALSQQLVRTGTSIDDCIQRQHARRSASNVAARNIITSLRELASFDWCVVFEKTACVEALLRERPDYAACDRRTRARYRASIEQLARVARRPEPTVTVEVLRLLETPAASGGQTDLGAWLIGPRRAELEVALRCPVTLPQRLRRWTLRHGAGLYLGSIALLTAVVVALVILVGTHWRVGSPLVMALLAVLAFFPASELVITLLNREWLRFFPPRHLPCLALEAGLGADMKTLVVVPTMLGSVAEAAEACRQLHVHALAAPDPLVRLALLSDWTDSDTETKFDDDAILRAAREGIAALNAAEPLEGGEPKYFLLHRRRQWNASEGRYIGWERKRGKLEELNRLLLDHGPTSFLPDADGTVHKPAGVRYVLTLDADTRLPLGALRDLVGTAAHPLNQPQVSPTARRVVAGYAVFQPRITPLLPAAEEHSLYREIITSGSGVDPYAVAASDLHQDLFGEGQYIGKGLYDLAAWEGVLRDRVPADSMLSHDLFEGLFARCALVSDVELFEDFPSHSEVAAARLHRWMRGDWQLLPWILGRRGPLPPLGRWKMLDNLRRSLLAPCSMALLVTAFADPLSRPLPWLLLVLGPVLWPALVNALERLARTPAARSRRMHLLRLLSEFRGELGRAAVALALLAQHAWLAVDAIGRAVYRMAISRRRLLEWVTAAQSKSMRSVMLSSFEWPLKSASIVVVGAVAVLMLTNPPAVVRFAPLLLLWWLSPVVARFLSQPWYARRLQAELPRDVERELRGTARLTWAFFERFVTAEDNHLPPDNFQEDPAPVVAHRTSPTNIGLYLLSTVAARDFGWLGLQDTCDRLAMTLASMQRLERFHGHFLNWYDTRSMAALLPRYVSTVDSGNLAGHLLTLRQACLAMRTAPLLSPRAFAGPQDAVGLCRRALLEAPGSVATSARGVELLEALRRIEQQLATPCATLAAASAVLQAAARDIAAQLRRDNMALPQAVTRWLARAGQDLHSHLQDLQELPATGVLARDVSLDALVSSPRHAVLAELLRKTAMQCATLVAGMPFGFLYERGRGLFSIGYRVAERELDDSYYDLLASEARLASLVAIARGDVAHSHWFQLGRRLTGGSRHPVLASWSGSMFEYLMPTLVMQEPRCSLLDQTSQRAVRLQIAYGSKHRLPWGISESAWNVRDREYTYQYSGFGLPTLGLKRGLGADYVVAPYATALAAMYRPEEAAANLRVLAAAGARGEYGYYEAMDYSAARVPDGKPVAVVRAYMAHHQGMTLVALDNVLQQRVMRERFHAEPAITAADLLLQERGIRFVEAPALLEDDVPLPHELDEAPEVARTVEGFRSPAPVTHLLSNRRYTVMLTDSGAGYSTWRARAVTRWREDAAQDCWGSFIYVHDVEQQRLWSAGFQPTAAIPDEYRVHFNEECAYIARRDGQIRTTMAVVVAPDDDGELRRITLRNDGSRPRTIELTSYAEVVLAPQRADIAHPAFSNLFVQTEFLPDSGALLAKRRPRSERDAPLWAVHVIAAGSAAAAPLQYETDRNRFIGRGNSSRRPQALRDGQALSNTAGNVLDPVFSLRTRVSVPPRATVTVTFATFVAESREQALALAVKYRTAALFDHVMESAWTFARADLHYLRSSLGEAMLFQSLAAHLLVPAGQLRGAAGMRDRNTLDVSHLWRHSISGDRPILLVRCHSHDDLPFIQQILRAQEYLRIKQLLIDVVILNERRHSYLRDLQQAIEATARGFGSVEGEDRGGIFTLTMEAMSTAEQALLVSLARVVMNPVQGNLQEQLSRPSVRRIAAVAEVHGGHPLTPQYVPAPEVADQLEFFNGWGGFAADSDEYRILLTGAGNTPAPWSNVLANAQFGSLVTERGAMCTWSVNSRENQLTPWSNDAVVDPSGECFYLMADDGDYWSPAPQPVRRQDARYEIAHGQGYSRFEVAYREFHSTLTVLVAADDPVKLCHLRLTNTGQATRRVTVITYVEWALAASRALPGHDVQTRLDAATGAQFACNPALIDFGSRIAFCDLGGRQQRCTASRQDFLGRNGSAAAPAGLWNHAQWSGAGDAGLDPCCAFAVTVELRPGATEELTLVLGQATDAERARWLVRRYRELAPAAVLAQVRERWDALLGQVRIRTPDRALDLLCNRWLPYQTIACRLWGRSAFYQSGGAYGFRDQLQDGMAVNLQMPQEVRAHLLRAAARQYPQGDVQHWWHPPSGRGVRTHFSDDRVWLPFAVHRYLEVTHDAAVLDEAVPFIDGPELPLEREDAHYQPGIAELQGTLYEHCARALDRSLATGAHGLPLIGGGDWNDGMNRVGHAGRGESVWMAWFLIATLRRFAPLAQARHDQLRADRWRAHADALAQACEREAWDGDWYRRAYFDDGTPLGSRSNAECRIDSLAQSWAVLSEAADPARARAAMDAMWQQLVRVDQGLVLLFTPPFDSAPVDPGYIKGYLPGLRENGGQYTHAAVWVLIAEAMLGHRERVGELLRMLNPVLRSASPDAARTYRVEPYVLAADIYSGAGLAQQGGWTWYTGAAGWMYRAVLEHVLGIQVSGETLRIRPCVPDAWPGFEVELKLTGARYLVRMRRGGARQQLLLDGHPVAGDTVPVVRDGGQHLVEIELPLA